MFFQADSPAVKYMKNNRKMSSVLIARQLQFTVPPEHDSTWCRNNPSSHPLRTIIFHVRGRLFNSEQEHGEGVMSAERTFDTPAPYPEDVQVGYVVVPLLVSAFLVMTVLAYRCRANRLRRERLAQESEQELRDIRGEGGKTCEISASIDMRYRMCTVNHLSSRQLSEECLMVTFQRDIFTIQKG